jgi:hypothetical protein
MPTYRVTLERRRTIVETAEVEVEAASATAAAIGADHEDHDWLTADDQLDWQGVADVELV